MRNEGPLLQCSCRHSGRRQTILNDLKSREQIAAEMVLLRRKTAVRRKAGSSRNGLPRQARTDVQARNAFAGKYITRFLTVAEKSRQPGCLCPQRPLAFRHRLTTAVALSAFRLQPESKAQYGAFIYQSIIKLFSFFLSSIFLPCRQQKKTGRTETRSCPACSSAVKRRYPFVLPPAGGGSSSSGVFG